MMFFDRRPCPVRGCGGTIHLTEFNSSPKRSSAEWVCMPSGAQGKIGTPHLLNQSVETNKGVEHTLRSLWILGDDDLDDEDPWLSRRDK
jgi:hypothetical protein